MSFSQGEHTFEDGILISGEEIRGYTAASALVAGEPVAVSGEYEVDAASEAGAFVGVAAYDVAAGEEVAVLSDTCEVRGLLASEAISAGDAVTTAGSGKFRVATGSENAVALAQTGAGGDGETFQAYLTFVVGNYGSA